MQTHIHTQIFEELNRNNPGSRGEGLIGDYFKSSAFRVNASIRKSGMTACPGGDDHHYPLPTVGTAACADPELGIFRCRYCTSSYFTGYILLTLYNW